jgi:hypothetical protein
MVVSRFEVATAKVARESVVSGPDVTEPTRKARRSGEMKFKLGKHAPNLNADLFTITPWVSLRRAEGGGVFPGQARPVFATGSALRGRGWPGKILGNRSEDLNRRHTRTNAELTVSVRLRESAANLFAAMPPCGLCERVKRPRDHIQSWKAGLCVLRPERRLRLGGP